MAFQFPDPSVTPEFTGANGITYSWDATDGKWVVKGFPSTAAADTPFVGKYRIVHPDDFTGEAGTVGLKTASYSSTDKEANWNAPNAQEIRFASHDLNNFPFGHFKQSQASGPTHQKTLGLQNAKPDARDSYNNYLSYVIIREISFNGFEVSAYSGAQYFREGDILYFRTPSREQAADKAYVDEKVDELQNEIVELEEEIDAIAPSVERGIWRMTLSGILSGPGLITFYDGTFGNGNPTGLFTAAQSIWFHETDTDGTPHGFNNVEPGNLLELFVQGAAEYGLYEVVEVHDQTHLANPYWAIDVNFVRTLEPSSAAGNGDLIRLKTFQAPTGGTADGFVLKTGDTIPCDNSPISFPNTYIDDDLKMSVSNVQAYVKFTSKNTDDNSTKTVNIFQPGHANAVMTNGNVYSKQDFYGKGLKGFDGTNYRESSVDLSSDTGTLKYGDNRRFFWNSSGGGLSYGSTNIFGWASSGCVAYKPIQMYGDGIATHESHAIHKGYVDDKVEELLARIGELEMAGGVPRNYHFEQVQVREGYNWSGYATGLWLWGDEWDQSSSQPGTSSRKLQIKLPNNSDGSPRWLIKPQGHIIINDFEQYYDQRKVGSIIFYPGKIEVKEYSKSYGPQTYYEITGDFAPTASQYSQYWSRESQVRMTFVGGSVEEVPTP